MVQQLFGHCVEVKFYVEVLSRVSSISCLLDRGIRSLNASEAEESDFLTQLFPAGHSVVKYFLFGSLCFLGLCP